MKPVAWIAEGSENLYWDKVEALADSNGWITPLYKGEERMTDRISGDGAACVDHDYFWRPIETAPHGVKLQLLSIYGVASHGLLSPAIIEDGFWVGWTPLPKRRKEND